MEMLKHIRAIGNGLVLIFLIACLIALVCGGALAIVGGIFYSVEHKVIWPWIVVGLIGLMASAYCWGKSFMKQYGQW